MKDKLASEQIDSIIKLHSGWKTEIVSQIRSVVTQSKPNIFEEVKWKMATRPVGLPVWSYNGIICFAEIWKDNVKLLFPKGAQLKNSASKLFNARLKSKDIRAIEFREGDKIDKSALKVLILEAIKLNIANASE